MLLIAAAFACTQAAPDAPAEHQAKNAPFIAGSYNIRYDNVGDGVNTWSNRKEWVKELIRFYEWDVFGTQEALRNQVDQLAEMSEYGHVGVGRDDGKSGGEHTAIFFKKSRFELLSNGDFWFSETPEKPSKGWDAMLNRVCSWAKLKDKQTGKTFFFFSAHFDHKGAVARVESSKLMLKKIEEIAKGAPTVFVGDLNARPDTEIISILDSKLKDSFKATVQPPYGPVGTANGFDWERPLDTRIDYIFVTPGIEVQKYGSLCDSKEKRYPSDHLPIMSKVLLP